MRIKLAFAAISVVTLSVVACQPQGEPSPAPQRPPVVGLLPPCGSEDQVSPDCTWYADRQGNGSGLSFDVVGGTVVYWSAEDYEERG